jgi:DNA (cytosine-5)-methyltransferase 3A
MSCGQIAFDRAGIPIEKYYASEIDKYAITITQKNYPNTIQLGSITDWESWNIEKPDIIIGGSPCQGFSFAGKQLNFNDERSKLFFTFVEILKHYKPKYFLLENVVMKAEYNDVISGILGELYPECVEQGEFFRVGRLEPIKINSALVSAQNRERLYWTNIQGIKQPEDKGILLKDIIENGERCDSRNKGGKNLIKTDIEKSHTLMSREYKGIGNFQASAVVVLGGAFRGRNISENKTEQKLEINNIEKSNALTSVSKDSLCIQVGTADINGNESIKRVYSLEGKSPTLTAIQGGNQEPKIITHNLQPRNGKGNGGKGHLQKEDGKSYCLDTANGQAIEIQDNITWRKLTPLECERLQTVDDGYTEGVSNSQRYKMLGNGWTVSVIEWIFSFIIL